MTPGILEISFDGPHGLPATLCHRFDNLGDAHDCHLVAQQIAYARREGRRSVTVRDYRGEEIATFALDRITGIRVYRAEIDRAFDAPQPDSDQIDRKSAAAGG